MELSPVETRAGVVRNLLGNVSINILFGLDVSTTQEYFLKFKEEVVNNQTQMKLVRISTVMFCFLKGK